MCWCYWLFCLCCDVLWCECVRWRSNLITIFHLTGGLMIFVSPTTWWRWSQHSEDTTRKHTHTYSYTHTYTHTHTHSYTHIHAHTHYLRPLLWPYPAISLTSPCILVISLFFIYYYSFFLCLYYCCCCCYCCRERALLTTSRRLSSRPGLTTHISRDWQAL